MTADDPYDGWPHDADPDAVTWHVNPFAGAVGRWRRHSAYLEQYRDDPDLELLAGPDPIRGYDLDPAAYAAAIARARAPQLDKPTLLRMLLVEGTGGPVDVVRDHEHHPVEWRILAGNSPQLLVARRHLEPDRSRLNAEGKRIAWRALYLAGEAAEGILPCWPCWRDLIDGCEHPCTWPDPWPPDPPGDTAP